MKNITHMTYVAIAIANVVSAQLVHNQLPVGSTFAVNGENATYDYVIVGGGTAGLAIATRLAQEGRYSVAVLEAGGFYEIDNGNRSVVPGYDFYSNGATLDGANPQIDWMLLTTPQAGGNNKSVHYARGKCLGGSSARNYMVYQRPTVGSMQMWSDAVEDESWSWDNVLPYYERSATFTPPNNDFRAANATPMYDASVFGDGPLARPLIEYSFARFAASIASWVNIGWTQIGNPVLEQGFNSGELIGHGYVTVTIDEETQERSSSQTAYLDLALMTTQLYLYTHALAKRILFDSNKTATGVVVESEGVSFTISARKEIVLSAGAFQSPQLLMVSGVGPVETLEKLGIAVIKNAPGMQDNPFFSITFAAGLETGSTYQNDPARFVQAINDYNEHRTGFLTSSGADLISFQKLTDRAELNISTQAKQDLAAHADDWPEVMFWSLAAWIGPGYGSFPPDGKNYVGLVGSLTAPLSRGWVTINSSDTADLPIINPNWMTHPTDQELAVASFRRMRELLKSDAMQSIVLGGEAYPGENVTSYEDLLAVASTQAFTFAHASATCKMGVKSDKMAVVDSKARVFGINGLRVVDASAFPFLPPGQPQSTVYMFAEKIADEIKKEWVAVRSHDEL
ncbi:hypothetical protein LTR17_013484 [Elasticomyces elasticus]|nr:hypothetical protein LTR17_013484 [Elasticomyces elasticus]